MKTSTKILLGGACAAVFLFSRKARAMSAGTASAVCNLAREQVGLKEVPKDSNSGPQIQKFTGGRQEAWCGHFVAWVFRNAGLPLPTDRIPHPGPGGENSLASVAYTEQLCKDRGWWLPPSAAPAPGDMVFYATRGTGDAKPGRHIGIVVGVTPTTIETVEGNWGSGVAKLTTKRSDKRITGYGRVT